MIDQQKLFNAVQNDDRGALNYLFERYFNAFLLTGVHLKAGRGERNMAMRKGQINLLVTPFNWILHENPEENMMVAGDLNATPGIEEGGALFF